MRACFSNMSFAARKASTRSDKSWLCFLITGHFGSYQLVSRCEFIRQSRALTKLFRRCSLQSCVVQSMRTTSPVQARKELVSSILFFFLYFNWFLFVSFLFFLFGIEIQRVWCSCKKKFIIKCPRSPKRQNHILLLTFFNFFFTFFFILFFLNAIQSRQRRRARESVRRADAVRPSHAR